MKLIDWLKKSKIDNMLTFILYAVVSLVLIGLVLFVHSIKCAEEVDPNEPFLNGEGN